MVVLGPVVLRCLGLHRGYCRPPRGLKPRIPLQVLSYISPKFWLGWLILLSATGALSAEELVVPATVIRVYDGDTFTANARRWPRITIRVSVRLEGLDTPEIQGKCEEEKRLAIQAREALKELLGGIGATVSLGQIKRGKYSGRVIAQVKNKDGDGVIESMIQLGHGRELNPQIRVGRTFDSKSNCFTDSSPSATSVSIPAS